MRQKDPLEGSAVGAVVGYWDPLVGVPRGGGSPLGVWSEERTEDPQVKGASTEETSRGRRVKNERGDL